jgi:hypothetical protein
MSGGLDFDLAGVPENCLDHQMKFIGQAVLK